LSKNEPRVLIKKIYYLLYLRLRSWHIIKIEITVLYCCVYISIR